MRRETFTFAGHSGAELAGRLDLPDGPHLATALFAHCFTCNKDIAAARVIAGRLTGMGIAVLRFDFTGLGQSGGDFADTTFSSNVDDLRAAAAALDARGMAPKLLIGHSLGGAAVLRAAGDLPDVEAVATIGAPFDPGHVSLHLGDAVDKIEVHGAAEVNLGGRPVTVGLDFLRDVTAENLRPAIANLHKALLVLHSPIDQIVGVDNAAEIFMAARHPKSFVTLDTADHLLSRAEDAKYAADVIAAWAGRYLHLEEPEVPGAPEGVVRVREADPNGYLQHINSGPRHTAIADEPKSFGGTDLGMSPYGFLSSGLGACTSMTIRMYARRKGWALDAVSVDVTHGKVHCDDCEGGGKIDEFRRVIHLHGDLDDEQRARLVEIADKCPVHKTLERSSTVVTELGN